MQTFNFLQEYILENERVRLNPMHQVDIDKLQVFSEEQPEIWKYSLQPANGLENLKTYMETALVSKKEEKSYPFIVFDKRSQQIAGSTRFYDFQKDQKTVQIGYTWYGKECQGTGVNKQCKMLLLNFAFEELGIERVEFRADARNERSIAAMKSIGCRVEGILRSNCIALEGRRDSIILSILRDEWYSGVKEKLQSKIEKEKIISVQ